MTLVGLFCLSFIVSFPSVAGLVVDQQHTRYDLSLDVQVLRDKQGDKTLAQVMNTSAGWYQNLQKPPNFSFSSDVIWLKVEITRSSRRDSASSGDIVNHWLLELANANQDFLDVYQVYLIENQAPHIVHTKTGDRLPFEDRALPYRNFLFPIDFTISSNLQVYLRLANSDGLHAPSPLFLWQQQAFSYVNGDRNMGLGVYLGIMLVMAIYNLFLFTAIRDKTYLFYVGYVVCLVLWLFSYFGFSSQYLWPEHPELGNRLIITLACLWCGFMLYFVRCFLDTKNLVPWFDKLCLSFIGCLYICLVLGLLGSYALVTQLIVVMALLLCVPCCVSAWLCWKRGNQAARFFLLAWSIMLLAMVTFTLKIAGVLPAVFVVENAMQIGSALEVTLLSLGLADRINALKQQKRLAQEQALEAARASNRLKDEFLANTSHELRTPLNGIIGLAESLIDGVAGPLPQKANQNLAMVVTSGRRLSHLVNDLLDFSKIRDSHHHNQLSH